MDNWKLAWKIFEELKDSGADIGNASVFIIHPILEKHNAERGLTTDAPEMTVGDSAPTNEKLTNDADGRWECEECNWVIVGECDVCPNCGEARPESGLRACTHFFVPVPPHGYKKCKYCNAPAPDKPENRTPSPTPSFR